MLRRTVGMGGAWGSRADVGGTWEPCAVFFAKLSLYSKQFSTCESTCVVRLSRVAGKL